MERRSCLTSEGTTTYYTTTCTRSTKHNDKHAVRLLRLMNNPDVL